MKGKGQRELDAMLGAPGHSRDRATRAGIEPTGLGGDLVGGGRSQSRTALQQPVVPLPSVLARLEQGPFVGRAAALWRLRRQWERSRRDGGLVVLAGEPGIGKTRLAARVAAGAHADGGVVLYGRADEESVSPYQPFVEALRHYAAHRPALGRRRCGCPRGRARSWRAWSPSSGIGGSWPPTRGSRA